jgi:hypothetical protein
MSSQPSPTNMIFTDVTWRNARSFWKNDDPKLLSKPIFSLIDDLLQRFFPGTPINGNRACHREPYIKHVEDVLWEIRMKGKDGISRALYATVKPERVVVVRVFVKKTQKTPRGEIKLALKRAKEIEQ